MGGVENIRAPHTEKSGCLTATFCVYFLFFFAPCQYTVLVLSLDSLRAFSAAFAPSATQYWFPLLALSILLTFIFLSAPGSLRLLRS